MDWSPILISMKTASATIVITFFLGLWAAKLVVAAKSQRVKMVVDGILTLPMVLPPTVAGFFLLMLFGVKRPLGQLFLEVFGIKIVFSWAATVIAAVVISFPLMYRAARGAFEQVDETLIYAARTLGFSEWKIFWKVMLPVAMPGVLSGAILAFARDWASLAPRPCWRATSRERHRHSPLPSIRRLRPERCRRRINTSSSSWSFPSWWLF